jgi:hypothetical protein
MNVSKKKAMGRKEKGKDSRFFFVFDCTQTNGMGTDG